jgi:hypothetical protein
MWKAQYRVKGGSWVDDTATFDGVGSDAYEKFLVWKAKQPQRDYEYRLVVA